MSPSRREATRTLPVAILCGGRGTRIAAVAGELPKALVPVAGVPFIEHQLRWLYRSGASDVILLTGYRGDLIRDFVGDGTRFGLRVRCRDDGPAARGTAGALRDALPMLGSRFITLYGDALQQADPVAIGRALEPPYEGVMAVFRNEDREMISNVRIDGDRVAAYDKQAPPGTMTHIDYGINVFRASAFDAVAADGPADLGEVHRAMIKRGTLRAVPVFERWYEIGSPRGLAETERFLRTRADDGSQQP